MSQRDQGGSAACTLPSVDSTWVNRHTRELTTIAGLDARTERVPDPAGGFRDQREFVVHHTANVPPGFSQGYGDELGSFLEHWQHQDESVCGVEFSWDAGPSPYKSDEGAHMTAIGTCGLVVGHDGEHYYNGERFQS